MGQKQAQQNNRRKVIKLKMLFLYVLSVDRIEAELVAKQRGEDGPLIIKFYDEIGNRTNRRCSVCNIRIILFCVCVYRQMKTLVLPVPPGVRIGTAKTTVQVPVDAPTEPSRKRFLTLLSDGSGFCKYPRESYFLYGAIYVQPNDYSASMPICFLNV